MKTRISLTAPALVVAFALAALLGIILSSPGVVYAALSEFDDSSDPITRNVDENTPAGVNIGEPISATDADEETEEFGNTLTYELGGTDAASFDIDASTGQLITKAPLDTEVKSTYSVL